MRRRFSFTVSKSEYAAIVELAESMHVSTAPFARMLVFLGIASLRSGGTLPSECATAPDPPPPDTAYDGRLSSWLAGRVRVSSSEAWAALGYSRPPTRRESIVLASALVRLGYERRHYRVADVPGKRAYAYFLRDDAPSTPAPSTPRAAPAPAATPSAPADPSDPVAALVADPAFLPAVRIPALRLAAARVKVSGG